MQEPFNRRVWVYAILMLYVNLYGLQLLYSARKFGQVFMTRTVCKSNICTVHVHDIIKLIRTCTYKTYEEHLRGRENPSRPGFTGRFASKARQLRHWMVSLVAFARMPEALITMPGTLSRRAMWSDCGFKKYS